MVYGVMLVVAATIGTHAIPFAGQPPTSPEQDRLETYRRDAFTVVYHAEKVPRSAVELIADRVEATLTIVRAYLAQAESYEGEPYDTPLEVVIDPERGPYQWRSSISLPEQRVLNIVNDVEDARIDLGIVHEITHVLAASHYRPKRDRFYDDGLAVFLQHRFGATPNYPDFGEDLYIATARVAKVNGGLLPLSTTEQTRRNARTGVQRRLAYLQEGAFTQFLIEGYGLDAYFRIYHGEPLEKVTGATLEQLEERWRALIDASPVRERADDAT